MSSHLMFHDVLHVRVNHKQFVTEVAGFITEELERLFDALAVLVPLSPRSWRASATPDGAMLELQHPPLHIWLAIARQDGKPVPEFAKFDKRIVAFGDTTIFIPDWLDLHWRKVALHPEAVLSVGRWQAESNGWQIWITGNASAQLTHREMMLLWMGMVSAA